MDKTLEAEAVLGNLVTAVQMLENCSEFTSLMPEVRVNLAYALPEAQTSQDIATVEGQLQPQRIALFIALLPFTVSYETAGNVAKRLTCPATALSLRQI